MFKKFFISIVRKLKEDSFKICILKFQERSLGFRNILITSVKLLIFIVLRNKLRSVLKIRAHHTRMSINRDEMPDQLNRTHFSNLAVENGAAM